jgi:Secretion system C-terminal sorting domain
LDGCGILYYRNFFPRPYPANTFVAGLIVSDASAQFPLTDTGAEFSQNSIQVFPNPATDEIRLTHPEVFHCIGLQVTDLSGKIWFQQDSPDLAKGISVAQLPPGMYVVKVTARNGSVHSRRWVKIGD